MENIGALEKACNAGSDWIDYGFSGKLLRAYRQAGERGNERIDFNETLYDDEAETLAGEMRQAGIREFTISSEAGGFVSLADEFGKAGFRMRGIVKVKGMRVFDGGERDSIPAVLMALEE